MDVVRDFLDMFHNIHELPPWRVVEFPINLVSVGIDV